MGEFEHKPFDDIWTDTNIPADSEREFSAKIADVDIRDDFMFSYVMCNPQICIELLQYLLPDHKISRIEYYEMGRDGTEQPAASSPKGEPLKLDIQKSLNEPSTGAPSGWTSTSTTASPCTTSKCRPRGTRGWPSGRGCIRRTWTSTSSSAGSSTPDSAPAS